MTMKSQANIEEKLTCGLENDQRKCHGWFVITTAQLHSTKSEIKNWRGTDLL